MFAVAADYFRMVLDSEYGLRAKVACADFAASMLPKRVDPAAVHAMMGTHEKNVNDIFNMVMLGMITVLLFTFMYLQDRYRNRSNVVIKYITVAVYLYLVYDGYFALQAQKLITAAHIKKAYAFTPSACTPYMKDRIQKDEGLCHNPKEVNELLNERYSTIDWIVYSLFFKTLVFICISFLAWHHDGTRAPQGA